MAKLTFEEWKQQVTVEVRQLAGCSPDDLPDCCYRDWYDDGCRPKTAAKRAVRQAND